MRIRTTLAAVLVVAVALVVGATTWLVVGRTLRPVDRIRRDVEEITGARLLDRRVSVPAARDEVGRLARTMNAMLSRLEDSRGRQEKFVADASHELRSPLASLRQAAEVAHAHPDALPEGELAETASSARPSARRRSRLRSPRSAVAPWSTSTPATTRASPTRPRSATRRASSGTWTWPPTSPSWRRTPTADLTPRGPDVE